MSAGLSLDLLGALALPSNLFKSNLSAFKLNLMLCFLKPTTSISPLSLVSASVKLNLLLASSFLMSVCAPKLNVPFKPPFGKLGSFISRLPASLGISKTRFSILPLNGDENVPVTVRAPCNIDKSPLMPLLCSALGEPFMSANTMLILVVSPALSWLMLAVTFLLLISSFKIVKAGALKSRPCFTPLKLPEATSFKLSTKNSIFSGLASTSPLAKMSMPLPPNISPVMWLSNPFTLKCLLAGSTKKLPLMLAFALSSG